MLCSTIKQFNNAIFFAPNVASKRDKGGHRDHTQRETERGNEFVKANPQKVKVDNF